MYDNFILKESIVVEKFIMNHFDYCSTNKYIDEEELAKFVIRNIKNGLSKYNLDDELSLKILKKIILTRKQNHSNIKSGYIGVDSELFFIGFLNELLNHKILNKNNSLESAGAGIDIMTLFDGIINISEVKSSYQNIVGNNRIKILDAIHSLICKESKVLDQSNDNLMSIVNVEEFELKEKEIYQEFVSKYIELDDIEFEDYALQQIENKKLNANLLLINKDNLVLDYVLKNIEQDYKNKYCIKESGKKCKSFKKCNGNRITKLLDSNIEEVKINIYHILLSNEFTNLKYYNKLLDEIKKCENKICH